jgi:glycerophosphoryl diester phosphodiesterase
LLRLILEELYKDPKKIVVTSHRGFSGRFPENTLLAFKKAAEAGSDMIEFDIRGTKEREPVILHDSSIDRTSNGSGKLVDYTILELKEFNFSLPNTSRGEFTDYKDSGHSDITNFKHPNITIPTLKEALETIPENIALNIQIKETDDPLINKICYLFDEFSLYDRAYLTLSTFEDAAEIKKINPLINVCILERKRKFDIKLVKKMQEFGCKYIQPRYEYVTPKLCTLIKEMELYANMYYSDTTEDNKKYIGYGIKGILTNYPDILIDTINELNLC